MKPFLLIAILFASCTKINPIPAQASFQADKAIQIFYASQVKAVRKGTEVYFTLSKEGQVLEFDVTPPDSGTYWCYTLDAPTSYKPITYYNSMQVFYLYGDVAKYTGKTISLTFSGWFSDLKGRKVLIENGYINEVNIQ